MGLVISGGSSHTVTVYEDEVTTVDDTATMNSPLAVLVELGDTGMTINALDTNLGGSYTYGTGLTGLEVGTVYNAAEEQLSITLGGTLNGVGAQGSVVLRYDPEQRFLVLVEEGELFGGLRAIIGENDEFLGFAKGTAVDARLGLFVDYSREESFDIERGFSLTISPSCGFS